MCKVIINILKIHPIEIATFQKNLSTAELTQSKFGNKKICKKVGDRRRVGESKVGQG